MGRCAAYRAAAPSRFIKETGATRQVGIAAGTGAALRKYQNSAAARPPLVLIIYISSCYTTRDMHLSRTSMHTRYKYT